MNARDIVAALNGRWLTDYGMARCPAHDDKNPSLSVTETDGRILVRCHAGCEQDQVIGALRSRGLWNDSERYRERFIRREPRRAVDAPPNRNDMKRTEGALRLWNVTLPAFDTLAESYLRSRGLRFPPLANIRFHAGLKHPTGRTWPTMVALVTRGTDNAPLAIHRTFLARDGAGKAPVYPQKMMHGPCHGGAVRLGAIGDLLMIGEGIETCLSAMQATGNAAWAALSTSGLRALDLPDTVRDVVVLADGDDPGEAAAREAALRWKRQGRSVRIARPPRELDFNDLLLRCAPQIEERAA